METRIVVQSVLVWLWNESNVNFWYSYIKIIKQQQQQQNKTYDRAIYDVK